MAFQPINLTLWSAPQAPNNPRLLPQWWGYLTTDDTMATVKAAGYFNIGPNALLQNTTFRIGDFIYCVCTDGVTQIQITELLPNITTALFSAAALQSATVTGISPLTLSSVGAQLVVAPGAGNLIIPVALNFNYIFATAQYTAGGAIGVQYGSTAAAGGQAASSTLAAATLNGYTANELFSLVPEASGPTSGSINEPLYLTAATANFATGAGTITAYVNYFVVSAS